MLGETGRASLGTEDALVIAVCLAGLVLVGIRASRRDAQPEDYFLASRRSTWPAIGLSLIAGNMSSTPLIGLAGGAYAVGLSVYDYEWTAALILPFFCIFLLPFLLAARIYTLPEYLERRYGGRTRLYLALMTLFLNIFVDAAGVLYSGALVCRMLVPAAPLWLIAAGLAGLAALYTLLGGLRAVIHTQSAQAVLLFVGALAIAVAAFARAGGWHAVMAGIDPARLSLIRPADDPGLPWPGLVLGVPLLGFYYWCTNQFIVQRVLSARDLDQGRWGVLFTGALKLPILFLIVLPGSCAILLFPDLPRADLVYPTLIFSLLPAGMVGLVVAGFIAATMVATASTLNAAATLITLDVIRPALPHLSERQLVRIGRLATAGFLVIAVAWTPQLERYPSLWLYLQGVLAYAVPPIVALFMVGMFWRGVSPAAAATTLLGGSVVGVALFLANEVLRRPGIHFLYGAALLFAVDVGILVGVSLLVPAANPAAAAVWTPEFWRAETRRLAGVPAWRNYRVLSALLVAATALLVVTFR